MTTAERPTVAVVSLGGTVAMTSQDSRGAAPTVDAEGLVATVPKLQDHARVEAHQFSSVPSASLRVSDLIGFLPRLERLCDEGAQGLVITTGTDTLEEVSYLFDLLWKRSEALVVTGAMRTADAVGSDGPANLLASVTVAASAQARDRGCLVVLNDEVHAARAVRKAHTTRLDAFVSSGHAPIGRLHEGKVRLRARQERSPVLELPAELTRAPRVALLRLTLDQEVDLLQHAVEGYDGIVLEVYGAGHVPSWWIDALRPAVQRLPIAVTTRTGSGPLLRNSYGFDGSERDLVELGLHLLDDMDGLKARILLIAALLHSPDREGVTKIMCNHQFSGTMAFGGAT